ncbi:MAG: glycosyl hydrolase, partial [Acidobacteriaceae bacterium]
MITRRKFLHRSGLLLAWSRLGPRFPLSALSQTSNQWNAEFAHPPASAYPWAFVFWIDGNVTKEGITADLEGMQRGGVRGMTLFACVDLGTVGIGCPRGPSHCLSKQWFDLFDHLLKESDRLGMM